MAELVETYIDLPLGIVDAVVIAIAERLRLTEIAESYRDRGRAAWLLRGTRGRSRWGGNDSADTVPGWAERAAVRERKG